MHSYVYCEPGIGLGVYGAAECDMKSNVSPNIDYQKRLKDLDTPEEIAAFAQELIVPALERLKNPKDQEEEEDDPTNAGGEDAKPANHHVPPKVKKRDPFNSPWFDAVANETEATVVDLYAKGMTTRDIVSHLKNRLGAEISQSAVSAITDKVFPMVKEWLSRPLAACYPILYLDGMRFKRQPSRTKLVVSRLLSSRLT